MHPPPLHYHDTIDFKVVEELVNENRISVVGTADLDKNTLQELYEWATVSNLISTFYQ